jgi:hypothetical protein
MKKIFIETDEFRSRWLDLGMSEEDLRELQNHLLTNPLSGPMIQGTGGVRKLRWARTGTGQGKSGGIRVIYFSLSDKDIIWLITAFGKNEQANLSSNEKKMVKELIKIMVREAHR